MDFFDANSVRYSCRRFAARSIDRSELDEIMAAVLKSPSACNSQPWKFVVVDSPLILQEFKKHLSFNKFCKNVPAFAVMVRESANFTEKMGDMLTGKDFRAIDHGIAAQTLCLAAAARGINSCILGMFDQKPIKKLLNIPARKQLTLIVALGYEQSPPSRRSDRKKTHEVLSYNSY